MAVNPMRGQLCGKQAPLQSINTRVTRLAEAKIPKIHEIGLTFQNWLGAPRWEIWHELALL